MEKIGLIEIGWFQQLTKNITFLILELAKGNDMATYRRIQDWVKKNYGFTVKT